MKSTQVLVLVSILCVIWQSNAEDEKRHFLLVHGACHGAWSWYKVSTILESHGHNVTALDLAGSGINPKQVTDVNTFSDYFKPLMEFMEKLAEKERVILVGHSLGGLAISQAMESFPRKVAVAVFPAGAMPGPSTSYNIVSARFRRELLGAQLCTPQTYYDYFTRGSSSNATPPNGTFDFDKAFLASRMYQQSPPEDLTLATTLVRPLRVLQGAIDLSEENYGSVRRVFIISGEDNLLEEARLQWMLTTNPPDRVWKIGGADHMAMMSRPNQLSSLLLKIAKSYP